MVGAGGIGCELLKTLVMMGFLQIEIIDLDTIDLSNLNRQFLFQKQHIKQSKAKVARESALKMNPDAKIIAHHASIFDRQFNLEWFKSFDIVLNALDNLAARRHVNMMCMAAKVPLVESGTTGYLGQVTFHLKNVTKCFDCEPKPTPKTYPVCTIRSTPSAPIHCIVWAKSHLFVQLFGEEEEEEGSGESNPALETDNQQVLENLKCEVQALKDLKDKMGQTGFEDLVFQKVFHDDIENLCAMQDLWKDRQPPKSISLDTIKQSISYLSSSATELKGLEKDQKLWTLEQNYTVFVSSLGLLARRLLQDRSTDPSAALSFDKDDADAVDFVTASSNLRSVIYGIQQQTRFKVKEMAANIIPAIATTNALIAGKIVIQAIKVLCNLDKSRKDTFVVYESNKDRFFYNETYSTPNPQCAVCRVTYLEASLDANVATLEMLKNAVLGALETMQDNEEVLIEEGGRLLYDPDFDDNIDSSLGEINISNGSIMTFTLDDMQDDAVYYSIKVLIRSENRQDIHIQGDNALYRLTRQTPPVEKLDEPETINSKKRPLDNQHDDGPSPKKHVIVLDEADDQVIDLD